MKAVNSSTDPKTLRREVKKAAPDHAAGPLLGTVLRGTQPRAPGPALCAGGLQQRPKRCMYLGMYVCMYVFICVARRLALAAGAIPLMCRDAAIQRLDVGCVLSSNVSTVIPSDVFQTQLHPSSLHVTACLYQALA